MKAMQDKMVLAFNSEAIGDSGDRIYIKKADLEAFRDQTRNDYNEKMTQLES
jgi:hypothetical protein